MRFTHTFIDRPILAIVVSVFITLIGLGALFVLPISVAAVGEHSAARDTRNSSPDFHNRQTKRRRARQRALG